MLSFLGCYHLRYHLMFSFFTVSKCYHFYVIIFPCTYFVLSFMLSFDVIIYCYHFPPFFFFLKMWHTPASWAGNSAGSPVFYCLSLDSTGCITGIVVVAGRGNALLAVTGRGQTTQPRGLTLDLSQAYFTHHFHLFCVVSFEHTFRFFKFQLLQMTMWIALLFLFHDVCHSTAEVYYTGCMPLLCRYFYS